MSPLPNSYDYPIPLDPQTMQPIGVDQPQMQGLTPANYSWQTRLGGAAKDFMGNRDLALALLANSGRSPYKKGFGEVLGTSMLQADQMKSQRSQDEFNRAYQAAIMQKMSRPDPGKPVAVIGKDGKPVLVPESQAYGMSPVADAKGPSALYKYIDPETGKVMYGDATSANGKAPFTAEDGPSAPSGYRWNGGKLEPIPGGPADPSVVSNKNPNRVFQMADKLRDEFNAQSKDFVQVGDSYNLIRKLAKAPSAAGDISMIFQYMKMLDPASTVREGEFATAQQATGVPGQILNKYNQLLKGERLTDDQRKDFLSQARNAYQSRKMRNSAVVDRYTKIAQRNGVNPDDVVGDMSVFEDAEDGAPMKITSDADYDKLPSGTEFVGPDGVTRRKP